MPDRQLPAPNRPTARIFHVGGRSVASLTADGRIRVEGEAAPALPHLGYAAPQPSPRLLDALAALLMRDLGDRHGAGVVEGR